MNTTDLKPLPPRPNIEQYKKQAKDFVKACKSTDSEIIQRIGKYHPQRDRLLDADTLITKLVLADAQLVIAREHGFESWPKFAKHIEGLGQKDSAVLQFESAADAIVTGDTTTLKSLLHENPELIRSRSTRVHRATLLHYISANGFENYRQKSPKNAVEVTKILLEAGAEVDAVAEMYGGDSTALGLLASSIHPERAGVQSALIETLLNAGAAIDGLAGGWSPLMAALANGRLLAAETLARLGARLDNIVAAAALGRLDLVKSFLNKNGSLKTSVAAVRVLGVPKDPEAQVEKALIWACLYSKSDVADFLVKKGVNPAAKDAAGLTALHWAASAGMMDLIKLLLERGAPLEVKNNYGGTVLDQTLWFALNNPYDGVDYPEVIEVLITAGANIDADWYPTGNKLIDDALQRHLTKL